MVKKRKKSLIFKFLFTVIIAIIVFGIIYSLPKLQDYQKKLNVRTELENKVKSMEEEIENQKKKISQQEDLIKELEVEKADLQIKLKIIEETTKKKKK